MEDGLRNHIKIQSDRRTNSLGTCCRCSPNIFDFYCHIFQLMAACVVLCAGITKRKHFDFTFTLCSQIVSQMNNFKFSHSINCCWVWDANKFAGGSLFLSFVDEKSFCQLCRLIISISTFWLASNTLMEKVRWIFRYEGTCESSDSFSHTYFFKKWLRKCSISLASFYCSTLFLS